MRVSLLQMLAAVRQALRGLSRTPLRTGLSGLGVAIGTGSVIAMLCIGDGARARVAATILKLNGNVVMLYSAPSIGTSYNSEPPDGLTINDYGALKHVDSAIRITPSLRSFGVPSSANGHHISATTIGVDSTAPAVLQRDLLLGAWFGPREAKTSASVCVISASVSKRLYGANNPLGKTIRLRGTPFFIVAVIADRDLSATNMMPQEDLSVFLPYTSMLKRLGRADQTAFLLEARTPDWLEQLKSSAMNAVEARRGSRKARFIANSTTETVEAYTESTRTITILLAAIGAISIIVGGIGVMNTMLVTVTERTPEIGVRLAIGTRPKQILWLFGCEAALLGLGGGFAGIGLGLAVAFTITGIHDWPIAVSSTTVVIGLFCSGAVGLLFGSTPALRAARLDPVQALRHQ